MAGKRHHIPGTLPLGKGHTQTMSPTQGQADIKRATLIPAISKNLRLFCMAGYHCLMPNGIFPANPSPMSNGIVSLLTAPCMLPNGIFFLSGCHCLMLIGIFPANLCPMPIGILFADCPFVCCLLHLFVLIPLASFFATVHC